MFQEMVINFIAPLFYRVLYMSIIGSIVGIIVYFIRNVFDKKMSGKSKCVLWSIVLISLLLPVRFEVKTNYAILENNFVDRVEDIKYISNYEYNEKAETLSNNDILKDNNESPSRIEALKDNKESPSKIEDLKDNNESPSKIEPSQNNANEENTYKMPLEMKIRNIVIPVIWITACLLLILIFCNTTKSIRKKISKNIYKNERIESILKECKEQLNIKANINIVLQEQRRVPSIFGILRPSILITEELLQEENEAIKYIFLHELSHYKRKDLLFNYILLITLALHWFNPIIWFLFKKIREDIEIGADEMASKGLTKAEKKEYGMVLINLLRTQIEKNYATNLLCMSDTGKNMERRISMIKRKQKGVIVSTVITLLTIIIIIAIVFIKTPNKEESPGNKATSVNENSAVSESVSAEETQLITNYINSISNSFQGLLPEFDNINNIKEEDKDWVYWQLKARTTEVRVDSVHPFETSDYDASIFPFSTKEQIEEDLKNIFGENFNLDIEKDLQTNDRKAQIYYNAQRDVYEFLPYGSDVRILHIIDSINKVNDKYKVKVIEYIQGDDLAEKYKDDNYILIYNTDDYKRAGMLVGVEEIFKIEQAKIGRDANMNATINSEVLERKDEFVSYTITIEKNAKGLLNVKSIER